MTESEYLAIRKHLLSEPEKIEAIEQRYMNFLVSVTLSAASRLESDFGRANDLLPFWKNYPPKQRGRSPTGTSIPWSEVGEKSLSSNLLRVLVEKDPTITFPGLPFGGDVRFATEDALIHFDIKLTGPNDRTDEVVAPPQQISGDGARWIDNGSVNTGYLVRGARAAMLFQPKLPPFYVLDGTVRLCLTFFLKAVYTVKEFGVQPLHYLEVACLPNGLMLFDGEFYAKTPGLLIPGKDDKTKGEDEKRTRVRLIPLASTGGGWRCQQIIAQDGVWRVIPR